jgi:hypothetical protein
MYIIPRGLNVVHWHSYYDRLYLSPSSPPRAACRLSTSRGDRIDANIREVNCERCKLKHTHEMQRSYTKLRHEILASKRKIYS